METTQYTDISVDNEQAVTRITINRPERMNAIRVQTYRELITALQAADASPACHVILLQGEGDHFSAGNDLSDLINADPQEVVGGVQGIFDTVSRLNTVLVAAVEGVAVGIGTTLLLHCDIVVAAKSARFRLPFVNLGVGPEGGSSVLLPWIVGEKIARELLMTGRFFDGEEALKWGLVNQVCESGGAGEVAAGYIAQILRQPMASLVATKKLLRRQSPDMSAVVAEELDVFSTLLQSDETQERIRAFLNK